MILKNCLIVGFGGAAGSMLRYLVALVTTQVTPASQLPIATSIVNLVGCFLIGGALAFFERYSHLSPELRLLFVTGVLGGFTTFSTFAAEVVGLHRGGMTFMALIHIALQVGVGVLLVMLGYWLVQRVTCSVLQY